MSEAPSKTQIDRLGERLRDSSPSDADLELLDAYRLSFGAAYEGAVHTIRDTLGLEPTGRPTKSTSSVIEKLRRESIRLSQIQDIAGCRLVVEDVAEQDTVAQRLGELFADVAVVDRRVAPSHGYRAVHVIAKIDNKPIEVQVRTALQHSWAQLSEFYADRIDPALKYGAGPPNWQALLNELSATTAKVEDLQLQLKKKPGRPDNDPARVERLQADVSELTKRVARLAASTVACFGPARRDER